MIAILKAIYIALFKTEYPIVSRGIADDPDLQRRYPGSHMQHLELTGKLPRHPKDPRRN